VRCISFGGGGLVRSLSPKRWCHLGVCSVAAVADREDQNGEEGEAGKIVKERGSNLLVVVSCYQLSFCLLLSLRSFSTDQHR